MKALLISSCCVGLLGCVSNTDDTFNLTGTEEYALQTVDGEYVCEAPKKVLICHIPPGNPDNAHTICVSSHAVEVHQEHHGDLVGACGEEPPPEEPPPEEPPPEEEPPPDEEPPPEEVPDIG